MPAPPPPHRLQYDLLRLHLPACSTACFASIPLPACSLLQVSGCGKDLTPEKNYYQRYRVCEQHLKMLSLVVQGKPSRFCQQVGG